MMSSSSLGCKFKLSLAINAKNALPKSPRIFRTTQLPRKSRFRQGSDIKTRTSSTEPVTEQSPVIEIAAEPSQENPMFVWEKNWYPVAVLADLDSAVPHPVMLLGRKLVLWKDLSGEWRCFEDSCPHRLAPLSEGRIEPTDGTLTCSYHGWHFDGDGKCTKIPQAVDSKAESVACNSSRSRAKTFPCRAQDGMLWVWPDQEPSAYLDASMASLPVGDDITGKVTQPGRPGVYMRDLPYGYSILVENLVDPSHLPVSHHGIGRLNRSMAKYLPMEVVQSGLVGDNHTVKTINVRPWMPAGAELDTEMEFQPPCFIKHEWSTPQATIYTLLWTVPTLPGQSRVFAQDLVVPKDPLTAPPPPSWLPSWQRLLTPILKMLNLGPSATWRVHLIDNAIFDGDGVFLNAQEHRLEEVEGGLWKKAYYLPVEADRMVIAVRKWLDMRAGGGPKWAPGTPSTLPPSGSRREQLDRFEQHTKNCASCTQALNTVHRLSVAAVAGLAVMALALVYVLAKGAMLSPLTLVVVSGAALCVAAWHRLQSIAEKFIFSDMVHAHT